MRRGEARKGEERAALLTMPLPTRSPDNAAFFEIPASIIFSNREGARRRLGNFGLEYIGSSKNICKNFTKAGFGKFFPKYLSSLSNFLELGGKKSGSTNQNGACLRSGQFYFPTCRRGARRRPRHGRGGIVRKVSVRRR